MHDHVPVGNFSYRAGRDTRSSACLVPGRAGNSASRAEGAKQCHKQTMTFHTGSLSKQSACIAQTDRVRLAQFCRTTRWQVAMGPQSEYQIPRAEYVQAIKIYSHLSSRVTVQIDFQERPGGIEPDFASA
ncbi:hypothetical protein [Leisingera sp. NJS204]|uniref:hypothetical protein n=1 Tax=Leisingera sp. NJS204 TaxID=2508307 RepID=UPI0020C7A298|nr:hypothetical protein [Leisingera sp. NJS204]